MMNSVTPSSNQTKVLHFSNSNTGYVQMILGKQ